MLLLGSGAGSGSPRFDPRSSWWWSTGLAPRSTLPARTVPSKAGMFVWSRCLHWRYRAPTCAIGLRRGAPYTSWFLCQPSTSSANAACTLCPDEPPREVPVRTAGCVRPCAARRHGSLRSARPKGLRVALSLDSVFGAAVAASSKTADSTVVLDVGDLLGITDHFVITSGSNVRQVRTIAEEIELRVKEQGGGSPRYVEGLDDARWVLLDYGQFVVHVFLAEARRYYDLERLWADAPRVERAGPEARRVGVEL